jgi:hypothetical protein
MAEDTATKQGAQPRQFSRMVPMPKGGILIAQSADDNDGSNADRMKLVNSGWSMFDDLVRQQNRTIEENVRMLAGQHHSIFHPVFGRFLDVTEWMPRDELKWRTRPTINRLLPWYMITHARMTENTPIVTFVPGPDEHDAALAELLDIAVKTAWWEANMEDVHDRLMAQLIVAGRGHLASRINPNKGPLRKWMGEGLVPIVDPYGQPLLGGDGGQEPLFKQMNEGVPFDKSGNPVAQYRQYPDGGGELVPTGEAHQTRVGQIEVDVLSAIQVRGSWGPQPWHQKRVHFVKSYHTPEEVYEMFGVEIEPNIRAGQVSDIGELERILYGTGFYGSNNGEFANQTTATNTEGYVEITQRWEQPCSYEGMEQTDESAGGRWTVTTPNRLIRDGVRPCAFPYTSNINTFEFVRVPGRPGGTTPQEALNPVMRQYNEGYGRIGDHVKLSTNPKHVIDSGSGMKSGQFTNRPGEGYILTRRPNVPAIEYIAPPSLGKDVYQLQEMLRGELDDLGFMIGAQDPGNAGESGEKLKEARFNTDRYMGPTMRRAAGEYGRVFETWMPLFAMIWDMPTAISYAGDDNIARTISVFPEMFREGKVNVRPDVESMLPEGRGEKQDKVYKFYMDGLFGEPGSPEALRKFWESIQMPHLGRVGKPGGIDRTTAEQENGKILLGAQAQDIPVYEWYDDAVHLAVHEQYMKSPEFLKIDPAIQDQFAMHRQAHLFNQSNKVMQAATQQAQIQSTLNPQPAGPGASPSGAPTQGGNPAGPGDVIPQAPSDRTPPSLRPPLPQPPRGGAPGGRMPTSPA